MSFSEDNLRKRVAYHEAGHAVLAVAERFMFGNTFLTCGPTGNGSIGGCTDWTDKQADAATAPPEAKARVLYAGQYAERHLAALDRGVWVPAHDENWNDDEDNAARALALALQTNPHADSVVRRDTATMVARFWRAIANVARELYAAYPNAASQSVTGNCAGYPPESRVIYFEEVLRHVGEDRIAEGAYFRFQGRTSKHGKDVEDWLEAQRGVASTHPEVVELWIADDNPGGPPFLASFRYASPADAQGVSQTLPGFGVGSTQSGCVLTVSFARRDMATLVVKLARPGEYVR